MKRMRDGKAEPFTPTIRGGSMQLAWAGQPAFLEILAVEAELEKKVTEAHGGRPCPVYAALYGKGKS